MKKIVLIFAFVGLFYVISLGVPRVSAQGVANVCKWTQDNGNSCDQATQYCYKGCPKKVFLFTLETIPFTGKQARYADTAETKKYAYGHSWDCLERAEAGEEWLCDDRSDAFSQIREDRDACIVPNTYPNKGELIDIGNLMYKPCFDKFDKIFQSLSDGNRQAHEEWTAAGKPKIEKVVAPPPVVQPPPPAPAPKVEQPTKEKVVSPKTLSQKFYAVKKKAKVLAKPKVVDPNGKTISQAKIKKGLSSSLPAVQLKFDVKKIKKGQTVSVDIPQGGLPVGKFFLTAIQAIDKAAMTVTLVDGTKPQLLSTGAFGAPDYPIPPSSENYEVKTYMRVDTKVKNKESHPWGDAIFQFITPQALTSYIKALRYRGEDKQWNELPAELIECGHTCLSVTELSDAEYFAIVQKK